VKERLVKMGASDAQVDIMLWLVNFGRTERIQSVSALAKRVNVSQTTLLRTFNGNYGAELTNLCSKLTHFRTLTAERATFGEEPLVKDLRVVREISVFADMTRISATIGILFGPNQSGKSRTLKMIYTPSHNHGRTIYVEMPDGGGLRYFLEELMKACGISERKSIGEMKQRARRYFDPQTLLIVDEFHQTMIGRGLKTVTIEFIRQLHDRTGCPILICGTDVVNEELNNPKFKKFLGQLENRGVLRRFVPAKPYAEDVAALCKAYGFPKVIDPEAKKLVDAIAETNGIGKLCKFLRMSKRLASNRKTNPTWRHFLETRATLQSWENGEPMILPEAA
jgi:AAA domain